MTSTNPKRRGRRAGRRRVPTLKGDRLHEATRLPSLTMPRAWLNNYRLAPRGGYDATATCERCGASWTVEAATGRFDLIPHRCLDGWGPATTADGPGYVFGLADFRKHVARATTAPDTRPA